MTPSPSEVIGTARRSVRRDRSRDAIRTAVVALAVAFGAVATVLFVALPAITHQSDDIARRVGTSVVQDARAQRIATGRTALDAANARLAARRLPLVPAPGPEVPFERLGDALLIQAARANVLADLPDPVVAELRAPGVASATLPSVYRAPAPTVPTPGRDSPGVTLLPGTGPAPAPASGGSAPTAVTVTRAPAATAAPVPAAPRTQQGLVPAVTEQLRPLISTDGDVTVLPGR